MFDSKSYGAFMAHTHRKYHEGLHANRAYKANQGLPNAWTIAITALKVDLARIIEGMRKHLPHQEQEKAARTEELIVRLEAFPNSLSYQIHHYSGTVLILSSDQYLEMALRYGTRELPILKPLQRVARQLEMILGKDSPIFIAKVHEATAHEKK